MKSKSKTSEPFQLPPEWTAVPRMSFTRKVAPTAHDRERDDIAFGVQNAERLINVFRNRERKLLK